MTLPATKAAVRAASLPVLLIEDEPAVMAYVRATLERSGYSVVCTESGVDGLKLLESGDFLGVVSDMRTPGGVNGADVHGWLLQHRPPLTRCKKPARLVWKNRSAYSSLFQWWRKLWGKHCER